MDEFHFANSSEKRCFSPASASSRLGATHQAVLSIGDTYRPSAHGATQLVRSHGLFASAQAFAAAESPISTVMEKPD